ncbi:HK97 gp10 family phage protein [Variovorax ginsengisoli]|uniref:HK97 gp10 family phage protein n=1 Tax=Variovorax ginsengisoli TaxID=363844 RepID=A0ABT8SDP1_9BURK|nr:HK97 gp10 family phage protein [Variovorax ginsengisoli]MDN8617871.1 HK97 gp10 family phage protein [Variovorax ginsengisoli]MDO1537041.1 HK97 gp10 family phage protein [Variovorax ginsengisoli]
MGSAFTTVADFSEEFALLDQLGEDTRKMLRPAAQAGAQVYYEGAVRRVPVATKAVTTKWGKVIEPGALKASVYQAFSADNSGASRATYHISWNAAKAPHGHLIENGHWTRSVGKGGR